MFFFNFAPKVSNDEKNFNSASILLQSNTKLFYFFSKYPVGFPPQSEMGEKPRGGN